MNTKHSALGFFGAWGAILALVTAAAAVPVNAQENAIEAIEVSPQQGGRTTVKVTLKAPPAAPPAGFSIANPPRIAFDFPNTTNASGRNVQEVSGGDLRRINVVQASGRTRMVLELTRGLNYDARVDGRAVLITLQDTASAARTGTTLSQQFAKPSPADQRHSLRDIDFRRGGSGEGRIVVDLSDNAVGIDIRQQGKSVIVDFINAGLPKNLERRLDVTDFGTPVQTIDALTQGNNARVVITPRGNWEHSAYQTDNRFIIEVKQIVEDPNRLVQGSRPGYQGEKISLNFQNVEVRAVLQVLADFTGLNIITSDTVTGSLTLRLKDVPWDQALDIILQAKGLDKRKSGNVVWIAPRDELATREKLALEARQQISELEPTHTESFQLNYQKAQDVQAFLSTGTQRILSKRGSAVVDARTNTVFVQDTPTRLEEIRRLLRQIDIPVRQVMIESRIVEAADTFSRNLGVRFGFSEDNRVVANARDIGGVRAGVGADLATTGQLQGFVTGTPTLVPGSLNVNLPAPNIAGAPAGVFSLLMFNKDLSRLLALEVSALQADGKGKIISSPRVITADKNEAIIEQGTEIPYQQSTSSGATSVSFKKATLSLKVKPQITPDDNVIMSLRINKDSVGQIVATGTGSAPSIDTKQVTTEVLVENGGTVVIGGIYTQEERSTTNKIPVLGDLPYVGFLFKNNLKTDDRRELLIFITPRILKETLTQRQ
jgi:type IV pilus assembly protein PilQ